MHFAQHGFLSNVTPTLAYTICVVRRHTPLEAAERIDLMTPATPVAVSRKQLQKCKTEKVLKLRDPPGSSKPIKIPVRFDGCRHVQCFDALSYLEMNDKNPSWNCPICKKRFPFGTLRKDLWFEDLIERAGENAKEVKIQPNGKFEVTDRDERRDLLSALREFFFFGWIVVLMFILMVVVLGSILYFLKK